MQEKMGSRSSVAVGGQSRFQLFQEIARRPLYLQLSFPRRSPLINFSEMVDY
jgi:hypothetical protein